MNSTVPRLGEVNKIKLPEIIFIGIFVRFMYQISRFIIF